ncbi:MAG: GNAT family N-acetyltransferase, partial [Desulfobacteraceae bacterium]|nr:GNAT family N-acetyltransferase [Desulfobacteraceae bacterium]
YADEVSIVGLAEKNGTEKIIAEARLIRDEETDCGEVAFLIEEAFQGIGVGTYLMELLVSLAREQGLAGVTADVLSENQPMIKVFEKTNLPLETRLNSGVYHLKISFPG